MTLLNLVHCLSDLGKLLNLCVLLESHLKRGNGDKTYFTAGWSWVSEMRLIKLLAGWLIQVIDKHQRLLIFSKSHLWQLKSNESYQLRNLLHVYPWYRHLLLLILPIFFLKSLFLTVRSLHRCMGFSLVVATGAYSSLQCSDLWLR